MLDKEVLYTKQPKPKRTKTELITKFPGIKHYTIIDNIE